MSDQVKVKGLAELDALLQTLPAKMEANILRSAMRAGAKVILDEARANVPEVTGKLKAGLKISTSSRGGVVKASVRTRGSHGYIANWVEYGTAAHLITLNDKERPTRMTRHGLKQYSMKTINKMVARGSLVIGGHFVGPLIYHPGSRPKPFMRPALDTKAQEAVLAVGNKIKQRLTKQGLDTPDIEAVNE